MLTKLEKREKKNSVLDTTTDTVETLSSNGNDSATPEETVVSFEKGTSASRSALETDSSDGLMQNASTSTPLATSDNLSSNSDGKDNTLSADKQAITEESSKGDTILTNPDVIIEKYAPADGAERDTKYLFVKTFIKPDGSRIVHFESITVQRDGMEVSVSSHEAEAKGIKKRYAERKNSAYL